MGWLFIDKPQDVKRYLDGTLTYENEHVKVSVLKSAIKHMREYYAAVEVIKKVNDERIVYCAVSMLQYANGVFGHKDMSENDGPFMSDCPQSIMSMLTPTTNETAISWREACQEKLDKRKTISNMKVGDVVNFKREYAFTNGMKASTMKIAIKFPHKVIMETVEYSFGGRQVVLTREQLARMIA